MRILVIAPHLDDEVLGVGGTLLKAKSQGHNIFICYCTIGSEEDYSKELIEEKKPEAERAAKILGAEKTFFLDFEAGKLNTVPASQLCKNINAVVQEVKPDILFIPHAGDLHTDHQAVFNACLVGARPGNGFRAKKVLCYETISETEWSSPYTRQFVANVFEDISGFLDKKLEALAAYKTELRKYPHPRSLKGVEYKARQRGSEVAAEAAEAFMLIRETWLL